MNQLATRWLAGAVLFSAVSVAGANPWFEQRHLLRVNGGSEPPPTSLRALSQQPPSPLSQTQARVPAPAPAQVPPQVSAQIPAQIPGQVPTQIPTQVPPQMRAPIPAQLPPQMPSVRPVPMPPRPAAQVPPDVPAPLATVKSGVDSLLARLGDSAGTAGLDVFLEQEIAPLFDFASMARYAAGPMYRHMSDPQRLRMATQIKQMFLSTMAEKLAGYSGQQVRYLGVRPGRDGNTATVGVAIVNPGRYPARVDFNVYRDGEDWKVFDVIANGQSAIVFYRGHFMRLMQSRPQWGYAPPR